MARFDVVSMMREDPEIIAHFIAYYRGQGAAKIHLFFDAETVPDAVAALAEGNVTVRACDAAFWASLDMPRPEAVEPRQIAVFQHVFRGLEADWVLPCDADEFLNGPKPLVEIFDAVPREVDAVLFPPIEAVWGPGEGIDTPFGSHWFRVLRPESADSRWRKALRALRLYGPAGLMMRRGFVGHTSGKFILRRGAVFDEFRLHTVRRDGKPITTSAEDLGAPLSQTYLAHFDAISFDRWVKKFRVPALETPRALLSRRSRQRRWQFAQFRRAYKAGSEALRRLFRGLYTLDEKQIETLRSKGLLISRDIFGEGDRQE
ncbi:glycosyltransferase family 2 protein [Paracoccaceae bacterium GXU_MW_L88]